MADGKGVAMRDLTLIILGVLLSMTFGFAFPKTSDEQKWEAFQRNREVRRAVEFKYEQCASQCREKCK